MKIWRLICKYIRAAKPANRFMYFTDDELSWLNEALSDYGHDDQFGWLAEDRPSELTDMMNEVEAEHVKRSINHGVQEIKQARTKPIDTLWDNGSGVSE